MKRIASTDSRSLGALISMCPAEDSPRSNHIYNREYQSMLDGFDEEGCVDELGHIPEKKRRLSVDQVKALERNFEVENKLEPERKVKLAQELGLQPRQVAVWFQNRRARWKTKQLERDYGVLKSNFDALHQNYESLIVDKETLLKEIKELKSKLNEQNDTDEDDNSPQKSDIKSDEPITQLVSVGSKEGPSDSDSSAILNEDNQSPNQKLMSPESSSFRFNSSSSSPPSINCFTFSETRPDGNVYHPQFVKMEEHNFFGGEEACNFFSEEQAPTLQWYGNDQWA